MQKKGVTVPVTQEQPPSDALYKFTMQKPRSVNVVGSYALRTIAKTKKAFNVDVAVEMPSVSIKEKDTQLLVCFSLTTWFLLVTVSRERSCRQPILLQTIMLPGRTRSRAQEVQKRLSDGI